MCTYIGYIYVCKWQKKSHIANYFAEGNWTHVGFVSVNQLLCLPFFVYHAWVLLTIVLLLFNHRIFRPKLLCTNPESR